VTICPFEVLTVQVLGFDFSLTEEEKDERVCSKEEMGVQEWMEKSEVVESRARVARAVQSLWLRRTSNLRGQVDCLAEREGGKNETYE